MENFEFFTPTRMIFGKNTHQQVGKIVKEYGFKKVLVHSNGASTRKSGLPDAVTEALKAEGVQYVTLGDTQANPTLAKAKEGIEPCLREGIDLVLAIEEGGVVDSARCIADGAGSPDVDVWTYFRQETVPAGALPVGVILTLSTSSGEMNASCVITDEGNGFKRGFNNATHHPLSSIYNPELTCTVSKYQTACGTVDIMMHALERYFSRTRDTGLTDHIAEALLKPAVKTGRIADREPDSYEARAALMWGGSLSHNGLTGTGGDFFMQAHQLGHELSGIYPSTTYGAGLAALWPPWARFVYPDDVNRFARYAVQVWNIGIDFDCPMNTTLVGIRATENFYKNLGTSSSLKELDVEKERLKEMAEKYTNMGKRTLPGIRELDKEEMMEIHKMAMGE